MPSRHRLAVQVQLYPQSIPALERGGSTTPRPGRFTPRKELYSILTLSLEGGDGSASRPGRTLPPGKTRYLLYRRLRGPQGRSGQVRKISPHRDSIPRPSSPQTVAIPTELPGPSKKVTDVAECRLHIRVPWDSIRVPRILLIKVLCQFPTVKEISITLMKHERTTFSYVVASSLVDVVSSPWLVGRCSIKSKGKKGDKEVLVNVRLKTRNIIRNYKQPKGRNINFNSNF